MLATRLVAAFILGIVNAILRPILIILTLPVQIVTLGLFTLVINAVLFYWVGHMGLGLVVHGVWTAFWGAHGKEAPLETFVISCNANYIANGLTWGLEGRLLKRVEESDFAYLVRIVEAIQEHLRSNLGNWPKVCGVPVWV